MNQDQITGMIRAIVPAIVAYFAGRGILLNDVAIADLLVALITLGSALWSVYVHTQHRAVANVAAMDATRVSADGKTITLLKSDFIEAAKTAATPPKN